MPVFKRLVRGIRQKDGQGFIYIYQTKTQQRFPSRRECWKIGCTSLNVGVKKRMNQWEKSRGHSPVVMGH